MNENFSLELFTTWTLGQNLDKRFVQVEVLDDERVKYKKGPLGQLGQKKVKNIFLEMIYEP